ncbi:DUF6507 family protein [Streptomyces physcomitrii]|uniref:Uncharacterized protein n=1 Tax=Streptomyces physcomitrii TaxID=2724184 RepID=A0ABX1H879_9ACTN|nr:DUF6507 family protein [Streptomyces physcomitrii]NKI44563.1 hypothetical protein [Streptomyces physcomitrii]
MTGWDLQPQGIRGVLKTTGESAEKIQRRAGTFGKHLQSAATHAGTLSFESAPSAQGAAHGQGGSDGHGGDLESGQGPGGLVAMALAQFATRATLDLKYLVMRSGMSLNGAMEATTAYLEGHLEMAANAQHKALGPVDLDPKKDGVQTKADVLRAEERRPAAEEKKK